VELFCITALPGQSVADLARRERERKKETASKTYSNADVPSGTAGARTTQAAAAPAEQQVPKPAGRTDNKGRDEKYWRNAFQTARDDLKSAQDGVRIAELNVNGLNRRLLTETSTYNREYRLAGDIAAASAALEEARRNVELAGQKITDLEDELRRSNGLPGWAR
jgi:hypothetical protein